MNQAGGDACRISCAIRYGYAVGMRRARRGYLLPTLRLLEIREGWALLMGLPRAAATRRARAHLIAGKSRHCAARIMGEGSRASRRALAPATEASRGHSGRAHATHAPRRLRHRCISRLHAVRLHPLSLPRPRLPKPLLPSCCARYRPRGCVTAWLRAAVHSNARAAHRRRNSLRAVR